MGTMLKVTIRVEHHLPNLPNKRYGWKAKMRVVREVRKWTRQQLAENGVYIPKGTLPSVVTMVDRARRQKHDRDNLIGAFKPVQDEVAAWFGVDDRDSGPVVWAFDREPAPWRTSVDGKYKRYDAFEITFFYPMYGAATSNTVP